MTFRTITFKALPYPLPAEYRAQLINLGKEAVRCLGVCQERIPMNPAAIEAYEEASRLVELYEKSIRKQLGVEITRTFL